MQSKYQFMFLAGFLLILTAQPALAEISIDRTKSEDPARDVRAIAEIPQLSEVEQPITRVDESSAQLEQEVVRITGVQLIPTDGGFEIRLETAAGTIASPSTSTVGNAVIADISNAVLALPEGDSFEQFDPAAGIVLVSVTNLPGNRVRISITGTDAPPQTQVSTAAGNLALNVMPGTATASTEENAIEVVVTATRTEENVLNVPRSVTVIDREEIEEQSTLSRDIIDIIGRSSPGLGAPTQGDSNFGQSIRGRAPQVLINGVPVTSNTSNDGFGLDLRSIAPDAIERIEIVRGPSAIYGDGATGGIINIITRQALEEGVTGETEVGVDAALGELQGDSFGNFLSQSLSIVQGDINFYGSFSRNDVGVFYDAEEDPIPSLDEGTSELLTLSALGSLGVNLGENQRLQLTATHARDEYNSTLVTDPSVDDLPFRTEARAIEYPEPNYIGVPDAGSANTTVTLNYTNQNLFGSQLDAQAYYRNFSVNPTYLDARPFDDPLGVARFNAEDSERWGGRLQIDSPLSDSLSLLWGADYSSEYTSSDTFVFDPDEFDRTGGRNLRVIEELIFYGRYNVENFGVFAQGQWEISDRWLLNGGARYERGNVDVPSFTNDLGFDIGGGNLSFDDVAFNAGLVFRATDELSLYASFAQGFSIPPISRILFTASDGFDFDRDIDISQPQKVDNYEIGVQGRWGNVQASLAAFYNESELGTTLVRTDPSPISPLSLVRAPQRNYGIEGNIDWQLGEDWQLGGTATWFEGEVDRDDDGDFEAIRSPEVSPLKLTAYIEHQTTPGWRNRLQALYVGSRDRGFDAGVDPVAIESYFVLDYIGSIQIGAGTLEIGVENLLDNQYATLVQQWGGGFSNSFNFPARGRTVSLGYRITW